ncbi:MAG: iron ABC transporter permease [Deltaproteobacteria bacterium]|nr:MAG: iron ABC transporter permease [Deltaproteobacteria bacterium]
MRLAIVLVTVALVLGAPLIGPSMPSGAEAFIFWQLRVPRVLVAAAAGAVLSVIGAAFQALFENPLATPSTTGTTAGAALGALIAILFLPGQAAVMIGAFVGALLVSLPVAAWAARAEARVQDVLLGGVALTLAAGAISSGLQMTADAEEALRAVRWSLGSVGQVGYAGAAVLGPIAVAVIAVVLAHSRGLQALVAGEARAASQGVDVAALRAQVLVAGSLGVGAVVAWCGPIAFVGLAVPHLVRKLVGPGREDLFWLSAVAGAGFLVGADVVARVLISGRELPVGVVTSAIGAPLLVGLVLRPRR